MINNKSIQDKIDQIALEMNLPKEVVTVAYRSQWEFIKSTLKEYQLYSDIDNKEEFDNLQLVNYLLIGI